MSNKIYTFKEYAHKKYELGSYYHWLMKGVLEYIKNSNSIKNKYNDLSKVYNVSEIYQNFKKNGYVIVCDTYKGRIEIRITNEEYEDLEKYLDNPEFYLNTKKYNL